MVLLVLLVLALFVMQTLIPGGFREPAAAGEKGAAIEDRGNRENLRPLTLVGQRATRALANMQEALPVFLALALMNLIVGTAAGLAITGAIIFLVARVLYVPLYLAGIAPIRSLAWGVGWIGLLLMIVPLVQRI